MIEEIDKHKWRAKEEKELPVFHYNNYNYAKALISKSPQSVVKVIGYREGIQETKNTMEYIARTGKEDELSLEDEYGFEVKGKEEIAALINDWSSDFDTRKYTDKKNRDSTHMMLSADIEPNEKNKEILEDVARDFLKREFFDKGFSYVFVVHTDTQHPHIHVVIKNRPISVSLEYLTKYKEKKLDLNRNDLAHLREQFAIEMTKRGLEQVATLRKNNPKKHLEDIEKRIYGDKEKGYKGTKEKLNWYKSKLEEKDWKFEDKNIRQYSAYLQMELIKIKEEIKSSNISRKDKTRLNLEHRELMKTLDLARKDKESEQLKHMVQNFKDKTLESIENLQKRNLTINELLDRNIESYQLIKNDIGSQIEEKLLKVKEKLDGDFPELSVKDAEYLGIDTSNLTTFVRKIEYKEKVLVNKIIDSKDLYEEVDKSYEAQFIDLKTLDLKNINLNQENSKLKEEIILRQKANIISKSIEPLNKYLNKEKKLLSDDKYKILNKRFIEINSKLIGDFPALSVNDAKFLGIDTTNLTAYEQEIKYKDKILASDLKTKEEFIVREVGIEIKASDLLTKKEFVVEEISKISIVNNIDLVNLNLKDIKFTESKIEESIKISQISKSIEPLQEYLKNEKINLPEKKYEFLENRLTKIKEKLDGDFPALSVNDAKFLGIDTTNLTAYEQEIKYKDKILASDLKTKEEFIVREVGIEIKASDLLTKKEFVVEEISKTSIVNNIDLVNLNLKDIKFKTSDLINIIELSQKTKAISESINPFIDSLESQKDKISIEHYNKLEKKLLNIKERLEKEYPSLSVQDAKYLGFDIDNLPKLESVEIKKEDGSVYTIQNIDLINLDISSLNEEKERIVAQKQEINRNEQLITKDINEVREVNHNIPTQEKINISSNEIESLKQMTLDELRITNPKPVLDALGITYKEQYGRLTFKTHAEKTASSNMYLDKNGVWKYKNFATGAGGTVENVIMDLTGMQYKEALNYAISNLGTKNYLDERFEDVKYENSVLRDEHLEKIKQLKEANINYQKESSSESKVVKIEEIYSTDKEVMDFLANRGIENIADGFYKITGQYEVNGKTFYNTGIGVLTNEHNISSNLEDVGADIHLLKPITLKNGNVLKTMSFGNKDITVLNNKDTNNKIAIFESKMDYAAAYSQDVEKFENTTSIISNGTGNYFKIVQELEKLNAAEKEVIFYNQNDKAGEIFITQIATKSNLDKFSFVKYQDNETGKDINDILKDKVNIEDRFLKEQTINEFIFNSKNKDDLEKVLNENPKIAIEEKKLIEERNLTFDKDDNSGFSKSITIERNAEIFRKIILEKEENIKYEKGLERLDEIKRYLNETYPKLSIKDAKFLEIDVSKFKTTINEIPYKVFDFSQSEEMKKEFKEFAKDFPTFAKNILNEAIEKQEISFEKLSYIGIKPTQFKNLTNNDFENEKVDLSNNSELLKEFNKLAKRFPELAKNELDKSIKNSNITTGKLSKYGMTPVNFLNYKNEHILNETAEIEFIDFEKNNIYKKDFIINIDYENSKKDINQNLDISSFNNSINETRDIQKSINEPNIINKNFSFKALLKKEEIKEINFKTVSNDFFKDKDLSEIKKEDLNIYKLKHQKEYEKSEVGYLAVKSTSNKLLEVQAGLTSLLNESNSIEKAIDEVSKSKVSIFEKVEHKDILKGLKKDFIKNVAKLSKDTEKILNNSILIYNTKDKDFFDKYVREGLDKNPIDFNEAFKKSKLDYESFKKVYFTNELNQDKLTLKTTLTNYKNTLEKSLKAVNKELGVMDRARNAVIIKDQLKKIDKAISKGIGL
ncbi:hypothetical protein FE243_07005 [Aliarcobacter thereius]|uniref:relaxase/mobilization nuclease domain-containing protein n=1 Tax=Aliarcobacter thereius TaxID=544718 RepID=UPI0010FF27F0|nr:toprim domain-containing protein [Aliarcobacter thereius]TLT06642.1 hypothetical protein FE243_07005 [Aliarcobacter thereius]